MGIDNDGYGEDFDDDGLGDELDEDAEPEKKKKRIATSTKVVLVVAGWLLLTLFLIGEFSKDKTPTADTVSAQLDTVDGDLEFDDGGTPDIVDTEAEALFDTDGDGYLSETERASAIEAYEAAVESGEIAIGEPWNGFTGGSATATDEGAAESAVPGAAPAAGGISGGTGAGAGTGGGTGGGGAAATTTTVASGGGGGGGATTTTAKPSGGGTGSTTTTARATTTTGPAPTSPPPPAGGDASPVTITITGKAEAYGYPDGYSRELRLPHRSRIRFDNVETGNSIKHSFTILGVWDSQKIKRDDPVKESPELPRGTYVYKCTEHPLQMEGTLEVF